MAMLGPQIGMGPVYLQKDKLKKCDELHTDPCDPIPTDQCCAVIPCTLCLQWEVYETVEEVETLAETLYGTARFDVDTGTWTGIIAERDFVAYWEHGYESGECEFVVELDSEETARLGCGDVSCRDPGGSIELTAEETRVVFSWSKRESLPLKYVKTDEGCIDFFCGNCECTCKVLCVSIRATIEDGESVFYLEGKDELTLSEYLSECELGPDWSGAVRVELSALTEDIEVNVWLERDPYTGDCWLTGTARGQELTPTPIVDCANLGATFTLYDGSIVVVKCKQCECASDENCEFCCLPLDFTQPEYPAGVLRPIPYELIGCGDDKTGNFATSSALPCIDQVTLIGGVWSTDPQPMYTDGPPLPDGSCPTTPCFNTFTLILECTDRFAEPGDNAQCDRLWLWIGSVYKLVGDDGTTPPATGAGGATSWIRTRATSCECDVVGGVSAIFMFDITIDCSEAEIGDEYGPCAGLPLNCCEYSCSGTLII